MRRRSLFVWALSRLLLVLVVMAGLLVVHLVIFSQHQRQTMSRERLELAAVRGARLIPVEKQQGLAEDGQVYGDIVHKIASLTDARVSLLDRDGRLVMDSALGTHGTRDLRSSPEVVLALSGQLAYQTDRQFGDSLTLHHVAVPIERDGEVVGVLRLSKSPLLGGADLGFILRQALLPIVVLGALLALCALYLSRKIESVTDTVTNRIVRFGQGDLDSRAGYSELDEFLPLTFAFDEMAEVTANQLRSLRLERRQWEAVFTGMREGILAIDSEVNMLTLNQAARVSLGLSDDEDVEGRPLFTAIRNANLNHFIHEMFRSQDNHLERELEIRSPSGAISTYRLSAVRFTYEEDQPKGVLVVMHDITRIRRLEEMRREFVANVSHELKTPITSIKGFIETLDSCLDEPEQARRFLQIIQQQTDRLTAIIDDLLTLSRLEQADHWVAKDFVRQDIAETVDQAIKLCAETLRQRHITVECDVAPCTLYANHRLLEQAVTNLVDNAAKYSPDGASVKVSFHQNGQHVKLQVADNGPGIPLAHQERIFERFHRVDKSRDRQTGGTGLGLSIVKHIMRVHGGKVTVQSKVGQGACFTLTLPHRHAARRD